MAIAVEMPKLSDTMEEGILVEWLAEEGDEISAGDVIAQVETDKATMDLEVFDNGVLLKKVIEAGDAVPIGGLIAVLGDEGEDISDILSEAEGGEGAAEPAEEESGDEEAEDVAPVGGDGAVKETQSDEKVTAREDRSAEDGRLRASPLARRLASEHDVELGSVSGSGPQGRIIKRDIEAAVEQRAAEPAVAERPAYQLPDEVFDFAEKDAYESQSISQMRKTIARRLAQSKYTAPHFYLTIDVDMERAIEFRAQLNELAESQERPKVSYNDLVTKVCAMALRQHPDVNASYLEKEGEIRRYNEVHIGVAVAIEEGLVTPVIRHADRKGIGRIAVETREMAGRARERKLQLDEMEGSTFTTSNLGMFGIEEFTAIINPPNSCILAIGAIRDVPVVQDGVVVPGKRMKLTLSCDHRVVDGATGARFLNTVKQYLEEPMEMML